MKKILSRTIWTLVIIYAIMMTLLHIPVIQTGIARIVGSELSGKIGSKVDVKRVDLGFLNRIVIDELTVIDQKNERLLRLPRLSAKIDVIDLMQGKINLSSVQIFGLDANIYKDSPEEDYNFQFMVDSLSSKDKTDKKPLDLHISSLVILNGNIRHNLRYQPKKTGRLDENHLEISRLSSHVILYKLTDDSIDVNIKRLSLKEKCGLNVSKLTMRLNASNGNVGMKDFELKTEKSDIEILSLALSYSIRDKKIQEKGLNADFTAKIHTLSPQEMSLFLPFSLDGFPAMKGNVRGKCKDGNAYASVNIGTKDKSFSLETEAGCRKIISDPHWKTDKLQLSASSGIIGEINAIVALPQQVLALGDVKASGTTAGSKQSLSFDGEIVTSECGDVSINAEYEKGNISGIIKTSAFDLGKLMANDDLGIISTDIDCNARIEDKKLSDASIKALLNNIEYKGYTYTNANIEGEYHKGSVKADINIIDPNVTVTANATASIADAMKSLDASIDIDRLNLLPLNVINNCKNDSYSLKADISLKGSDIDNMTGSVSVKDIDIIGGPHGGDITAPDLHIDNIRLVSHAGEHGKEISLNSDFADLMLKGDFRLTTLGNSLANLLKVHLPSFPVTPQTGNRVNDMALKGEIRSTLLLKRFLGIDLDLAQPLEIQGYFNDFAKQTNIYCDAPSLEINGKKIDNLKLLLWTPEQSLHSNLTFTLRNAGKSPLAVILEAEAKDDILSTHLSWDNHSKDEFSGQLNTKANISSSANGLTLAKVSISPSNVHVGDSLWHLHSRDIVYADGRLSIDHFAVENANQHIYINGMASKYPSDSLTVDLKNVNVEYIMNLVNFHSVEFGGFATGHFCGKSILSTPEANGHLDVDGFLFEYGRMGNLHADVRLNNDEKQIDITAHTEEEGERYLNINGFVSPQRSRINLDIEAVKVPLDFMHSFCGSFMEDIDAWGKGKVRLFGPLSGVNLEGKLIADGALTISSLNCRYSLRSDTITFVPDDIRLANQPIYDKYGNAAYFSGGLHHHNLSRLTYDFDIKAENFLCYDFNDFGENTFYGTAFLSGDCKITGRSSELTFDINGDVEPGSFVVYNASSPDALSQQEFITWKSATRHENEKTDGQQDTSDEEKQKVDVRTNMRMNFLLNVTPDATLKLLMDARTGDYIDLHGTGVLRANYYNKGKFDLFGNYLIDNGTYKLTIQNVVHRNFDFQNGGSINFGGDPFNAILNLQARYVLNSVSLADLNIGSSFSSNNIRVDCLMDITGTAGAPVVSFNLEPHTNNTEVKQMIYSLINSEEKINQQVLYLLSVGRFYAQAENNAGMDARGNSQTSLAMQSILSGTLSQQMNNILSKFVNSSKWNFGANISPGDEGFNNAEYEGLLNGSLLNNRLLINGQFGYRDNAATATQGFIGDFDVRYLLLPNGNIAIRVYNQTNDRYFTKNSLNTQGLGLILKRDFSRWRELFGRKKTKEEKGQ